MTDPLLVHAPNFRDVGGIPVGGGAALRAGIVYRSGVMDRLDDADLERLDEIGLATVVDLRSTAEVEARPNRLPPGVRTVHLPVHDVSAAPTSIVDRIAHDDTEGLGAPMLLRGNDFFATDGAPVFRAVLDVVTDPANWPVVVHCTAGKDRTGFAIASLLWMLGADHGDVITDYLRTNERMVGRHREIVADVIGRGLDPTLLEEMLRADERYLQAGLDAIHAHHGSLDAWFDSALGLDAAERRRRRDAMVEASVRP